MSSPWTTPAAGTELPPRNANVQYYQTRHIYPRNVVTGNSWQVGKEAIFQFESDPASRCCTSLLARGQVAALRTVALSVARIRLHLLPPLRAELRRALLALRFAGQVRRATLRSVHPHPVYLYHLYRCRSLFLSSNATLLLASAGGRTVTLRRTLRTGDELCRARAWPAPPPGHPRTPTWPRQSRLCERSELFPSTAAPLPPSSGQGATAACGLESSASASHDSCE